MLALETRSSYYLFTKSRSKAGFSAGRLKAVNFIRHPASSIQLRQRQTSFCHLSSVFCPLSSVFCPLSSVICLLSSVFCLLTSVIYLYPSDLKRLKNLMIFNVPPSLSTSLTRATAGLRKPVTTSFHTFESTVSEMSGLSGNLG